jgi:hypothetical protein
MCISTRLTSAREAVAPPKRMIKPRKLTTILLTSIFLTSLLLIYTTEKFVVVRASRSYQLRDARTISRRYLASGFIAQHVQPSPSAPARMA